MLKSLRKNTKVIIWTVIFCFILWGGFSVGVQFQKRGRIAGEVFGREVSFQEFNDFLQAAQIFSRGENQSVDPEFSKMHAWQNLILSREARRRKIEVADDEVRTEVLELLAAQKMDNPTPEFYRRWLQNTFGESPLQFERQVRELLRVRKLVGEIKPGDFPKWSQALMTRARFKDYLTDASASRAV